MTDNEKPSLNINGAEIKRLAEAAFMCLEPFEARDVVAKMQETINRQQAEIKKLQQGNVILRDMVDTRQAEIERLQKKAIMVEAIEDSINPLPFETDYDKAIKTAKAKAIKEFAEEAKAITYHYYDSDIDELLKERLGEG